MDQDNTQIITLARDIDFIADDRLHCLEFIDDLDVSHRYVVGQQGVTIGRTASSDIALTDSEVSRSHCNVALRDGDLIVTDLNSTNGTKIDGIQLTAPAVLPVGAMLQVGSRHMKHEWRTRSEILQAQDMDRELQRARSYVEAILPPPIEDGPIKAEWVYQPSAKLGGDGFGYGTLSHSWYYGYLLDVAGHGAGAAMHSVAIMNQLRQRALPGTDMTDPVRVLETLNRLFQMDQHADLYFTIWYGAYCTETRQLRFASAGHHPAYLVTADRSEAIPLQTRNGMIGAMPDMRYTSDSIEVPAGASLYMFSDGVYEITTRDGDTLGLGDFLPLLTRQPIEGLTESRRLLQDVRGNARPGGLDDDFSVVVLDFA